jgi:hypothetical protein
MKYFVVEPFTLETQQGCVTLPAGKALELTRKQAAQMGCKIKMIRPVNGGRDLTHYCLFYGGWCSEKLPGRNYHTGCVSNACEHFQASQNDPQIKNDQKTILTLGHKGDHHAIQPDI